MNDAEAQPSRVGLVDRVWGSYWNFSDAMRRLLAERPSETTLLSFLIVGLMIHAFAGVVDLMAHKAAAAAGTSDSALGTKDDQLQREIFEVLIGRVLIGAIGAYLLAIPIRAICAAFGGAGGYYETRAALFWALLVAAPPILLLSIIGAVGIEAKGGVDTGGAQTVEWIVGALQLGLFAIAITIFAGCLKGAHRFSSTAKVLGGVLAVLLGAVGLLWGGTQLL